MLEPWQAHPRWGPKELHAVLARMMEANDLPSIRTIARILEFAGMVRKRDRHRTTTETTRPAIPMVECCNQLWTADLRSWWRTNDGARAELLTIRDAHSRFVLAFELMQTTEASVVRAGFERVFEQYGLPEVILVEDGSPFASTRSPGGLTTLSVWWVSLGVKLLRDRLAHPADNGGHECMHLNLRYEIDDIAADDLDAQRIAIRKWRATFIHIRPHESLEMRVPAEVDKPSWRCFTGLKRCWYPSDCDVRKVGTPGYIKYKGPPRCIGLALAEQSIGLRHTTEAEVQMLFCDMDLGLPRLAG